MQKHQSAITVFLLLLDPHIILVFPSRLQQVNHDTMFQFQRQYYKDFGHFNMFNHHFFELEEEERFRKCFVNVHKILIVVDPPYGGLLKALQRTIEQITESVSVEGR